jgi:hypothetical protein
MQAEIEQPPTTALCNSGFRNKLYRIIFNELLNVGDGRKMNNTTA